MGVPDNQPYSFLLKYLKSIGYTIKKLYLSQIREKNILESNSVNFWKSNERWLRYTFFLMPERNQNIIFKVLSGKIPEIQFKNFGDLFLSPWYEMSLEKFFLK